MILVSILIPVYNEGPLLPLVVERVRKVRLPAGCDKEIIILDDGSTDGTSELADFYASDGIASVYRSARNLGKGAMLRQGFAGASGEIILIQDADLEYNPDDYVQLLQPILDGRADVVYGSRFLGRHSGMAWPNWVANKVLTFLTNLLFRSSMTDEATGYKAFRAGALRSIRLRSRRFEFCSEVTAKLLRAGFAISEVPISYRARHRRDGKKIRWHDGLHAAYSLVRYRLEPSCCFIEPPPATRTSVAEEPAAGVLESSRY